MKRFVQLLLLLLFFGSQETSFSTVVVDDTVASSSSSPQQQQQQHQVCHNTGNDNAHSNSPNNNDVCQSPHPDHSVTEHHIKDTDTTTKCGLYMAPSAIPNSGMGMYSARAIASGERIFYGDVVIQVEDYELNNQLRRRSSIDPHRHRVIGNNNDDETTTNAPQQQHDASWLLNSYYWDSSVTFAQHEAQDIQSIIPGLGMLANSHTGLVNAHVTKPHRLDYHLHRAVDVGAGASSTYHDCHFTAAQHIAAGEEIFVKYGDAWFLERQDELGRVPLHKDFVQADALLKRFWRLQQVIISSPHNTKRVVMQDAWNLLRNVTQLLRERLASALPVALAEIEHVIESGTAAHSTPHRIRSLDWLAQNGRCLDNLQPRDSALNRQAGKGAFATRNLSAGDVVAPIPVVQILRQDMEVYHATDPSTLDTQVEYLGKQLLINYCYGHRDSSLLLFPYSPVVNYLNHHATHPNVKLQWSNMTGHHEEWRGRSPAALVAESHTGLVMELVALRDIAAGEEVLLDYGPDWTEAWNTFHRNWNRSHSTETNDSSSSSYRSAAQLNQYWELLRTEKEQKEDPYPFDNVVTMCYVGRKRIKLDDVEGFGFEDAVYEWTFSESIFQDTNNLLECQVLRRDAEGMATISETMGQRVESIAPANVMYSVEIVDEEFEAEATTYFIGVPRNAIEFFDRPYTSDLFLRNSFRHEIHLPEEMVSNEWRDLSRNRERNSGLVSGTQLL